MLAGPSISGVLLTALVGGKAGLRDLLRRTLRARVAPRWHAAALLTAPLLWIATLAALASTSPAFLPGIVTATDRMELVRLGIAVGLGAAVFEEIGWTGFAIPHVRQRYGVFATGLIVGVLWGAWHLLTNVFWAIGATSGELPLSIFVPVSVIGMLIGYLAAFRVLMVWLYERTGSVFLAIVMHASLTASVLILDPAGLSGAALLTYGLRTRRRRVGGGGHRRPQIRLAPCGAGAEGDRASGVGWRAAPESACQGRRQKAEGRHR